MDLKSILVDASGADGTSAFENILVDESLEVYSIIDAIDFMDTVEIIRFFSKTAVTAANIVSNFSDDDDGSCDAADGELNVSKLRKIATILIKRFDGLKDTYASMLPAVEILHDTLIPLDDTIPGVLALKVTIARICEKWWVAGVAGSENLVTQLIPYLLIAGLSPTANDADVKRLYSIRTAILLLDFDDESIESIRSLVLRCFIHPAFLRGSDGRKFLSFLLTVHEGLNTMIMEVMKPQIAAGSRGIPAAYGEVLFRVWKDSSAADDSNEAVSTECIEEAVQGLFHDAIHAADPKYFKGLRVVLGSFHDAKRLKGVDSMLLKTYGPILWRSLRCANSLVRAQATLLFFDAFPLQGSNSSAVESDAILQKQFDLLSSLLKDVDHRVRAAAASGVCHILREYWSALPAQTTKQILSYVVGTLGRDSNCATVRLAVVQGLGELLDQPLSHTVLKNLLPLAADALHDKSAAVRVAFIKILNKVKNTRGLHFCQIVSVGNLQKQFAVDMKRPAVCRAMTSLLLNSYYPQTALIDTAVSADSGSGQGSRSGNPPEGSASKNHNQIKRCLQFISENVAAAVAFYGTFHEFASVGSAAKLVVMLSALFGMEDYFEEHCGAHTAHSTDAPLARKGKRERGTDAVGDSLSSDRSDTAGPWALKVGVLKVMLSCLTSIAQKLPCEENEHSRRLLLKYFTAKNVRARFEMLSAQSQSCCVEDSSEEALLAAQMVPLYLQIVSVISSACGGSAGGEEEEMGREKGGGGVDLERSFGLDPMSVLAEFTKCAKSNVSHEIIASHSLATASILRAMDRTEVILDAVHTSFKEFQNKNMTHGPECLSVRCLDINSSPEPHTVRGRMGGKRKSKAVPSPGLELKGHSKRETRSDNLSFVNAGVLLRSLMTSGGQGIGTREADVFLCLRDIATSMLAAPVNYGGSWICDSRELVRCVHVWALCSVSSAHPSGAATACHSPTSSPSQDDDDSSSNINSSGEEAMEVLLSWVVDSLLPLMCSPHGAVPGPSSSGVFASPGVKYPPRSKIRPGTPKTSAEAEGVDVRTLGIQMLQAVLSALSDAVLLRICRDEIANLVALVIKKISACPNRESILKGIKSVMLRMSGVLQYSAERRAVAEVVKELYAPRSVEEVPEMDSEFEDENHPKGIENIGSPARNWATHSNTRTAENEKEMDTPMKQLAAACRPSPSSSGIERQFLRLSL